MTKFSLAFDRGSHRERFSSFGASLLVAIVLWLQPMKAFGDEDPNHLTSVLEGLYHASTDFTDGHEVSKRAIWSLAQMGAPAVPFLVDLVSSESGSRYNAVQALGSMGSEAVPAIPALIECFWDKNSATGSMAAKSLGQIGPAAVPFLMEVLTDRYFEARRFAAQALGIIGPEAFESVPGLGVLLTDRYVEVRRAAISSLAQIAHPDALPTFVDALSDQDQFIRNSAIQGLGRLVSTESAAAEPLRSHLEGLSGFEHPGTGLLLEALAQEGIAGAAYLADVFDSSSDFRTKYAALRALSSIPEAVELSLPRAMGLFNGHSNFSAFNDVLSAFRMMGHAAITPLTNTYFTGDLSVKLQVLRVLRFMSREELDLVPALPAVLSALDSGVVSLVEHAAAIAENMGADAAPAAPALIARLENIQLRVAAARALGSIGSPAADPAVPSLVGMLGVCFPESIASFDAAAGALARLGAGQEQLIAAATNCGPEVRRRALHAIGLFGDSASVEMIEVLVSTFHLYGRLDSETAVFAVGRIGLPALESLTPLLESKAPYALLAAGRLGPSAAPTAVPLLIAALEDSSPLAKQFAARALGQLGSEASDAVPHLLALLADESTNRWVRADIVTALGLIMSST